MSGQPAPAEIRGGHLTVSGLTKTYGGVCAVDDVDLEVRPGEILGLIGPNGSGKTTTIDCICGLQAPDGGRVVLDGRDVTRWRTAQLAHAGLIRTFQSVRVFESLSVRRNLQVAEVGRRPLARRLADLVSSAERWPDDGAQIEALIDRFDLRRVAETPAGDLSYGQRKLVEFAAACVRAPQVLLLDEPVAAVNPTVGNAIRDWIRATADSGTSVLLVEHNIEMVVEVCDRVIVLEEGRKLADGDPRRVIEMPEVQEAYFGRG